MPKTTLPGDVRARLNSVVAEAEAETPRKISQPAKKTAKPKSKAQAFKDLDDFLDEAKAGMPDDALCRAAGVSITSVLEWRKARGIKRSRGHQRRKELEVWATDPFGTNWSAELHDVESGLKAQWDLPAYVLRQPLNYDVMARSLYFLAEEHGASPDSLAKAFGLRPRDVEMAIAVEAAHLERNGVPCETCGRLCDPAYGTRCSLRCR